jgi:hypothetical protein
MMSTVRRLAHCGSFSIPMAGPARGLARRNPTDKLLTHRPTGKKKRRRVAPLKG